MQIVDAQVLAIRVPLKHSFTIAPGTLTHSNHVLVRLVDDAKRVGWGESTTFHAVYGYDQKSLYHVINDHLLPAVMGLDPGNIPLLHQKMDLAIPHNNMAKCAVDMAAYDLAGQAGREPVYRLIGKRRVDRIPVIAALGIITPEEAAVKARDLMAEGFEALKIKIGADAVEDLARIEAVKQAVGDAVRLRADANQGYDRVTARAVIGRLESLGLEWVEQPLPDWDLEGLADLADAFETPIAVDESVNTIHDAERIIAMKAADVVNIKLPRCGGMYRSQQIASICERNEIPCFLGGCLETTPGAAGQAHFYAATPNIVSALEMGPWHYVDDVVKSPIRAENGYIAIPEGYGLGVDIDEDKVAFYRVDL